MNLQEKELIEQARMMNVPAHEFSAKFIARDLVEAALTAVRKNTKLKENQEAKLIDDLNDAVKDLISSAVAVIAANGRSAIVTTVKSVMVAGKTIRVVSDVDTSDPQRHALTDTVNHRALLVLAPDEYYDALDSNKPQKDQNDLPLEAEPENPLGALQQLADENAKQWPDDLAKPAPLTPYELAFNHVTGGGDISAKAIQTAAGVKRKDVTDIILALAENGVISAPDDEGLRTLLVPTMTIVDEFAEVSDKAIESLNKSQPFNEDQYLDAVLMVQRERKVSISFIKSNFSVDEETAEAMILRMEQDGVISAPNDIGGRAIYD
jgi:DNA segregation ATPase FtsK/SpoIIIE-like protein